MDEAMSDRGAEQPEPQNRTVPLSWDISPRVITGRARDNARVLRRYQTPAEAILWDALRGRKLGGLKFRRQVPIGRFIVDFLCFEAGIAIEADGAQHTDFHVHEYDDVRTRYLNEQGLEVLRFSNACIENDLPSVIEQIAQTAQFRLAHHPQPFPFGTQPPNDQNPSPQRERGRGEATTQPTANPNPCAQVSAKPERRV
jgi:very-short-patch-repair endonuclease